MVLTTPPRTHPVWQGRRALAASPEPPVPGPPRREADDARVYRILSEKVGGVPNVRIKDHLLQGLAVLIFGAAGVGWGATLDRGLEGPLIGLRVGIVAGGLLSGWGIMIAGLLRRP